MLEPEPQPGGRTASSDSNFPSWCPRPPLRWVGVLSPVQGQAPGEIRISQDQLLIGRDGNQNADLTDTSISRKHARIVRKGAEFFLEDLESSNGTFIDDVEVVSCVLHDGDYVQFGNHRYYFERLLEPPGTASPPRKETNAPTPTYHPHGLINRLSAPTLCFWGTRGSLPTPGRQTEKYGGNTTCLEYRFKNTVIVFDAGSGIRALASAWAWDPRFLRIQAHLFFTHLHWDHIQGFPFFLPAYLPGNDFTVYGEARPDGGIRELLSGQMRGAYFPVPLTTMQANLTFRDTASEFTVGPVKVKTMRLPHPGGCLGYRLEAGSSVFVLATDCELDQAALNRDELQQQHLAPRRYPPELLNFFRGANLLVIDCQYTDEDYQGKQGWGHNSIATVADLCRQAQPHMAVLFHHDPESDDEKVSAMTTEVARQLALLGQETLVLAARERMTLKVRKPV